jgi:hypothetical protein
VTDVRRGLTGLSALVQTKLEQTPFSGHMFVFRGRRGDLIKVLWYDGDGLYLYAKRPAIRYALTRWEALTRFVDTSICAKSSGPAMIEHTHGYFAIWWRVESSLSPFVHPWR